LYGFEELSGNPVHTIYWQPIENYFVNQYFHMLDTYIDYVKTSLNVEYNFEIISK
jgi:hypothetical protein